VIVVWMWEEILVGARLVKVFIKRTTERVQGKN